MEGEVRSEGWKAKSSAAGEKVDRGRKKGRNPAWFVTGHLEERLEGGTAPQLGLRTETTLVALGVEGPTSFRVAGHVTWVESAPNVMKLEQSDSLFWRVATSHKHTAEWSSEKQRQFILDKLGCLHGQRIKCISGLASAEANNLALPLRKEELLEITYRFDDTMFFPWVVTECRLLSTAEMEQGLPPYFYQFFEGCACPRCQFRTWQTEDQKRNSLKKMLGTTTTS
jgi:hypothetical protein